MNCKVCGSEMKWMTKIPPYQTNVDLGLYLCFKCGNEEPAQEATQ